MINKLHNKILSIKTINYKGSYSTDLIENDLEKIKSINFPNCFFEMDNDTSITYSICFIFHANGSILIRSFLSADYKLELTIEKLQDDYYRVIIDFFQDCHQDFELLEQLSIEAFFDQIYSLKKYLNKIKSILYENYK